MYSLSTYLHGWNLSTIQCICNCKGMIQCCHSTAVAFKISLPFAALWYKLVFRGASMLGQGVIQYKFCWFCSLAMLTFAPAFLSSFSQALGTSVAFFRLLPSTYIERTDLTMNCSLCISCWLLTEHRYKQDGNPIQILVMLFRISGHFNKKRLEMLSSPCRSLIGWMWPSSFILRDFLLKRYQWLIMR